MFSKKQLIAAAMILATIPTTGLAQTAETTAVRGKSAYPVMSWGTRTTPGQYDYWCGESNPDRDVENCKYIWKNSSEGGEWYVGDGDVEYEFKTASSEDTPTRQSARRFYEWNPPKGEDVGSLISAHIYQDMETFRFAHPTHEKFFTNKKSNQHSGTKYTNQMIYLANENSWPDMLAATSMAARRFHGRDQLHNGFILTTSNRDQLDPETKAIFARLVAEKSWVHVAIVGGEKVISPKIEQELEAMGVVIRGRFGGQDRIETMVAAFPKYAVPDFSSRPILTRGYKSEGGDETAAYVDTINLPFHSNPMLLTTTEHLHPVVDEFLTKGKSLYLDANLLGSRIVGGPAAVSPAVEHRLNQIVRHVDPANNDEPEINRWKVERLEKELPKTVDYEVDRIQGGSRYETAYNTLNEKNQLVPRHHKMFILVDGNDPELFKTAYPARGLGSVLLTQGDEIPEPTRKALENFRGLDKVEQPGNEHRLMFCYASAQACTKAREILYP